MIDLRGIARRLRLSVDQIRVAADLLEQGYQPGFILRYRSDETGNLSHASLWALKLEVDRQQRLEVARQKALKQLPKDAVLDAEAEKCLAEADSEVAIDVAMRTFRARRHLQQSEERDKQPSELLQKLIAVNSRVDDLDTWVAEQFSISHDDAGQWLQQTKRLIGSLLQCDTSVHERLRRALQKKAQIQVENCENQSDSQADESQKVQESSDESQSSLSSDDSSLEPHSELISAEGLEASAEQLQLDVTPVVPDLSDQTPSEAQLLDQISTDALPAEVVKEAAPTPPQQHDSSENEVTVSTFVSQHSADMAAGNAAAAGGEIVVNPGPTTEDVAAAAQPMVTDLEQQVAPDSATTPTLDSNSIQSLTSDGTLEGDGKSSVGDLQGTSSPVSASASTATPKTKSAKGSVGTKETKEKRSPSKMTPRQRRRRWLSSMLQPMKSLKRNVGKLTAYQHLMLGRGRRSQLVKTPLLYDSRPLVALARDTFVSDRHPLVGWFDSAVEESFQDLLRSKIENDTLAYLEEQAQEKLLESATDQLRQNLMRRPVRGHTIMVVDTVGPKSCSVVVIDPRGEVLHRDEVTSSAQPDVVNQNVVRLGEIAHRFRVTLLALTNGPARRFLVLTVRELMKVSADSGLRWTMADRGGAEAYAAGRIALKELSSLNRRDRAAVWVGRALQNPMEELLKVDINRLRLGSYQRELPQEPLKMLIRETIADCVGCRGLDTHHANLDGLQSVVGVGASQAEQIVQLSSQLQLKSRAQLLESVQDWPEKDARQAIGFLRIFGSDQTLDGTLIHPDDYRLAERLIANTELEAPPAAPEGWLPPQPPKPEASDETGAGGPESVEPEQDRSVAAKQLSDSEEPQGGETAELESVPPESNPDAGGSEDKQEAASATGSEESAVEAKEVTAEGSSADEVASSVADDNAETQAAEQASANTTGEPDQSESASGGNSSDAEAAQPETESQSNGVDSKASQKDGIKPEYPEDVVGTRQAADAEKPRIEIEKHARGWQVGREKLKHVAQCLMDPFQDPRLDTTPVPMLTEMPKLGDLKPDLCLWAVVVGVADFGAFVEIGPDCSGLVHISRLSENFVEDPHQVVQVGDLILVWVVSVDEKKNRVALTALSPEQRARAKSHQSERHGSSGRDDPGGHQGRGARRQPPSTRGQGGPQRDGGKTFRGRGDGPRDRGGPGRDRGGPGRGRGGRSAGRRDDRRSSKPVVITSKQPKKPISEAMKEGDEPLRSFSDLMQFYESKRTEEPGESKPAAAAESKPHQQTEETTDAPSNGSEQQLAQDTEPNSSEVQSSNLVEGGVGEQHQAGQTGTLENSPTDSGSNAPQAPLPGESGDTDEPSSSKASAQPNDATAEDARQRSDSIDSNSQS